MNVNATRQPATDRPYLNDIVEPKDGVLKFIDNAVVRYYERKVYNLKRGFWESQAKEAIRNKELSLVIDGIRRYPDEFGCSKGIMGYYISFTINVCKQVARNLKYIGVSSAGVELVSEKVMERIEGSIEGIPTVVPRTSVISYLNNLISKPQLGLKSIKTRDGKIVPIVGSFIRGKTVWVYGYTTTRLAYSNTSSTFERLGYLSETFIDVAAGVLPLVGCSEATTPYIENFIEPEDGALIFKNNMIYRYFERKVYDLVNSWELETQEAISNKELFLVVNGHRRYPDNDGINRAPLGFYVPFSVEVDEDQAQQIKYVDVTFEGLENMSGQFKRRYFATVSGLWTPKPVPFNQARCYFSKLVWQDYYGLAHMKSDDGTDIVIDKCSGNGKDLSVHGYSTQSPVNVTASTKVFVANLSTEGICNKEDRIAFAYERWVGKIEGLSLQSNVDEWFTLNRNCPSLTSTIYGDNYTIDHIERREQDILAIYHVPLDNDNIKHESLEPTLGESQSIGITTAEDLQCGTCDSDPISAASFDVNLADETHRVVLRRNFAEISQTVNINELINPLYKKRVLSSEQTQQVKAKATVVESIKCLLFFLLESDIRTFYVFVGILKQYGNDDERRLGWKLDKEIGESAHIR